MLETPSRKLVVIVHADVVGSTALVQTHESLAHERIRDAFNRLSSTYSSCSGTTREVRGDALVVEFSRASDTVCAALVLQAANIDHNAGLDDEIRAAIRIGISLGEAVIADSAVTGAGVILAQRLEQLASLGGVVVQGAVSETVPSRLPFAYESLGEHQLKGFEKPVRAFVATLEAGAQVPKPECGVSSTGASGRADHAQQRSGTLEIPEKPSVAVLPFANMNQDSDQEYFSDGITEDIFTELQRFHDLFVIARNSSFTYKGKPVKVQDIAADLGVRYVVEGSVRSSSTPKLGITFGLNAMIGT